MIFLKLQKVLFFCLILNGNFFLFFYINDTCHICKDLIKKTYHTFSNKLEGADAGEQEKTIYHSQFESGRYIVFSASSRLEFARHAIFEKLEILKYGFMYQNFIFYRKCIF